MLSLKISILTPSFNSAVFIEKAIHSVIDQGYENFEHIIVDGGSNDGTVEILGKYPHLMWVSEPDKGQSDAMNKAFLMSTGDVIVYLNADDWFCPGAFNAVAEAFKSNSKADIVTGKLLYTIKNGELRECIYTTDIKKAIGIFDITYFFPWNPVAYFYKRKVQEEIGLFPVQEHYAMDFWFMLRAFGNFKAFRSDTIFGVFNSHGANKTSNHNGFADCKRILFDYIRQEKRYLLAFIYYRSYVTYLVRKHIKRILKRTA